MSRAVHKIAIGAVTVAALVATLLSYNAFSGNSVNAKNAHAMPQWEKSGVSSENVFEKMASSIDNLSPQKITLTDDTNNSIVKNPAKLKSELHSPNAILVSLDDRKILINKNADQKIYPASMTKIMTAILAIEKSPNLQEKVTLPKPIFDKMYAQEASMAGFVPNEQVSEMDLLYGAILPSGAECCAGLADHLEGSEQNFAHEMNRKAAEIGMEHTHFVNTTGLYDANHYSTVKDISMVLCYALQNNTFRRIFTTPSYTTSPTNKHAKGITFTSTMFRHLSGSKKAGRATILGGKVGYTNEAGLCLASCAEVNGKQYVLVTAGAKNCYCAEIKDAVTVYSSL